MCICLQNDVQNYFPKWDREELSNILCSLKVDTVKKQLVTDTVCPLQAPLRPWSTTKTMCSRWRRAWSAASSWRKTWISRPATRSSVTRRSKSSRRYPGIQDSERQYQVFPLFIINKRQKHKSLTSEAHVKVNPEIRTAQRHYIPLPHQIWNQEAGTIHGATPAWNNWPRHIHIRETTWKISVCVQHPLGPHQSSEW